MEADICETIIILILNWTLIGSTEQLNMTNWHGKFLMWWWNTKFIVYYYICDDCNPTNLLLDKIRETYIYSQKNGKKPCVGMYWGRNLYIIGLLCS